MSLKWGNVQIFWENQSATENVILDGKETSGSINDIETEYASVEDVINKRKTASNETTVVSEIPNTIDDENIIIAKRWMLWRESTSSLVSLAKMLLEIF